MNYATINLKIKFKTEESGWCCDRATLIIQLPPLSTDETSLQQWKPGSRNLICDDLGLEETLADFRPGPFPTTRDVLRHFSFHFWGMRKRNVTNACLKTADSLLSTWAPSYLPLRTKQSVKKKVFLLYQRRIQEKSWEGPRPMESFEC